MCVLQAYVWPLGEDQSAFMLRDEMLLINYCLKIWTLNGTAFLPKFFFLNFTVWN